MPEVEELIIPFHIFSHLFTHSHRNWFDLMIICLSIMEAMIDFWVGVTASSQGVSPQHLRFVRTVRLARALRGVRVMRLLRYVSALRTLVLSIMSSSAKNQLL